MELVDAATHAASAAGGGLGIGFVAKVLIQNWIKSHDKRADKTGDAIHAMAVELKGIGTRLDIFEKVVAAVSDQGRHVAVLQTEMKTVRENLNGLGAKIRSIPR